MTRGVARMLAMAALVPLAVPARAVADQSFTTSGSITYTWQGDPARGCAAEGVCGVQGALILRPQGVSSISSGGTGSTKPAPINVPIDSSGATVRVSDGPGAGECVDTPTSAGGESDLVITPAPGRGLVGHLRSWLSSGRCAGPLQQDLAAIALPVRRFGGRHPSYDVRTSQSFAAGPFSGTVVSTLVARTAPVESGSSSSGSFGGGVPTHKALLERVTLRYRFASLPGSLDVAFSGEADPFCTALDSCGASGTLALTYPRLQGTLVVGATRQVSRRVDAREALADLRRGRLRVTTGGFAPRPNAQIAQVTESFTGPGGLQCHDVSQTPGTAQLFPVPASSSAGGGVSLGLFDPPGSAALRTHCPGPFDLDVFGDLPGAVKGSIGLAQLLSRHPVMSLRGSGSFAGPGYVGTRSGALNFSLTLEHVRAGTIETRRP